MADELSEIMDRHPEIIFIPYPCPTWKGFLKIECPWDTSQAELVTIKLVVPKYPQLQNAEIYFGPQVAACQTKKQKDFKELLKNATSVSSLLCQMQIIIGSVLSFKNNTETSSDFSSRDLIEELHEVLSKPMDVRISSTRCLEKLVLSAKNISMTIRKRFDKWEIMSNDLPSVPDFEVLRESSTLQKIVTLFAEKVNIMAEVWEQLSEIDKKCWVIDPMNPKHSHLYRRIRLDQLFSIAITVDPLHITEQPDIKFLGSESKVQKWEKLIMQNLTSWNSEVSIYENLRKLLQIEEFPQAPVIENIDTNGAHFTYEECCICYELENNENGQPPDKMCGNENCTMTCHSSCLFQWLQSIPENKMMFDEIQGDCPQCGEHITCPSNI